MSGCKPGGTKILYSCEGRVITGNRIGRTMGIPTVNIPLDDKDELPQFGVYVANVYVPQMDLMLKGVANLGVKPTIENASGSNPVCVEVNLLDFTGDLYGQDIKVDLLEFVRREMKFDNLEALKEQINKDIKYAKDFFDKTKHQMGHYE